LKRELQSVHPVRPVTTSSISFLGITKTYVGASGESKLCSLVGILKQEDAAFLPSAFSLLPDPQKVNIWKHKILQ